MKKNWDIAINKPDYGKVSEICTWTLEAIFVRNNEIGIKFYQISVKSGYHLAHKISRDCDRTECSTGVFGSCILLKIWRIHLPKKIKVFMWRACKNILPTHVNSMKRRVISEETCEACKQFPDTSLHLLWVCNVAQDVWASYSVWLRKCIQGQ